MENQDKAVALVKKYLSDQKLLRRDTTAIDIKLVWFCKTLQNWKALVADVSPGGMFFEVTYNGNKKETYLDAYQKTENVCIPDER